MCSLVPLPVLRPAPPLTAPLHPSPPMHSQSRLRSVRTDEIKFSFQKDPFISAAPLTNVTWQSWRIFFFFPRPMQFSSQQFYISYFWRHSQNLYIFIYLFSICRCIHFFSFLILSLVIFFFLSLACSVYMMP